MHAFRLLMAAGLGLAASGCESSSPSPAPQMVVRFGYLDDPSGAQEFLARVSRPSLLDSIRAEFALPVQQRHFPNGLLRPAVGSENLAWRWAFEVDGWHLTDNAIELCDGTPQYLHDHFDAWLTEVGHYCPWSAFVKDTAWVR